MAIKRKEQAKYEAQARIAKAMAHPSRLRILDLLRQNEMCVGDLTQDIGADQSTVSKHLAVLRDVGLVAVRKEGAMCFYQLKCNCLDDFFSCMEAVLVSDLTCRQQAIR